MRPFLLLLGLLVVTYAESLLLGQFLWTTLWLQEETMRPFLTPAWPFPLVVTYAESLFEFHLTDAASLVDPACKICFLLSDGRGNHCHTHLEGALPG